MRRLGWCHFLFEIPELWEVVGYSLNDKDGKMSLSTEAGECMQIQWKEFPHVPNVETRLQDWAALQGGGEGYRMGDVNGWKIAKADSKPFLAVRYDQEIHQLLTIVFPVRSGSTGEQEVARSVLESFDDNSRDPKVWAAFGLDVALPPSWDLVAVTPNPAAQRFDFADESRRKISVHRYGMLPHQLCGNTEVEFFARLKGNRILLSKDDGWSDGAQGPTAVVRYSQTSGKLLDFWKRPVEGRAWFWREPGVPRLFIWDQCLRRGESNDHPLGSIRWQ